jgi:hypothetical protein
MPRKAILGVIAAVAILAAIGATAVIAGLDPSAGHYSHTQASRPAYLKGSIQKNCLDNQGECALVVH